MVEYWGKVIDYKELLHKYIWHVGDAEGSCFLPREGEGFEEDEMKELRKLSNEEVIK